jgi:hypothetical protein
MRAGLPLLFRMGFEHSLARTVGVSSVAVELTACASTNLSGSSAGWSPWASRSKQRHPHRTFSPGRNGRTYMHGAISVEAAPQDEPQPRAKRQHKTLAHVTQYTT